MLVACGCDTVLTAIYLSNKNNQVWNFVLPGRAVQHCRCANKGHPDGHRQAPPAVVQPELADGTVLQSQDNTIGSSEEAKNDANC